MSSCCVPPVLPLKRIAVEIKSNRFLKIILHKANWDEHNENIIGLEGKAVGHHSPNIIKYESNLDVNISNSIKIPF